MHKTYIAHSLYSKLRGGSTMLSNANYLKVRVLHDLSRMVWYLDKHAEDAKNSGEGLLPEMCDDLKKDLEKHMEKFRLAVEGLSREGKFY
jgi:hypothetical protein